MAIKLHRQGDQCEERQAERQQHRADHDVDESFQEERRAGNVPRGVFDDGQIRDVIELDGCAEHAADRWHQTEFDLRTPAQHEQFLDRLLLYVRRRNDDAIERQEPVGALVHRVQLERVALRDDLDVDVREELELAADFRHRLSSADQRGSLRRSDPPPEPPSGDAEREYRNRGERGEDHSITKLQPRLVCDTRRSARPAVISIAQVKSFGSSSIVRCRSDR